MAQGDWSPAVLVALSSMFNGFVWESWNYGSAHPGNVPPTHPNYWICDIPYVDVIHLFSEMPLLSYFGYLPSDILVWLVFLWAGQLFGFDASLDLSPPAADNTSRPGTPPTQSLEP